MTDFAKDLEIARAAIANLEGACKRQEGDLPELLTEALPANITAQLLMNALPDLTMNFANKAYWLDVANHMGPDFIKALRHVAAFMAKVDEF
jgi:hypothetical protein